MAIKRVKLSDANRKKGKSREDLLNDMSDEEIKRRANSDPDNPILSDSQLKEFELAKKRKKNDKKD